MRVYNKNTKDDALSKFSIFALCSITRILLGENVTALTLQRKLTTHIKFNIFGKKKLFTINIKKFFLLPKSNYWKVYNVM